jgi:peptide/nickel transport system substrate-binding protein
MKKLRWQLLIVFLSLVAIGLLLIGQQPAALQQIVPAAQPATGGIYTEALVGSLGRLNPVLDTYNTSDQDIDSLVYSGLIDFDDRGLPYGDLAESWGISQDGTIYNFSIREEAVWHDGEPVTSQDVVFTVEMMRGEESLMPEDIRQLWDEVEVKALDEKTLQFILPEPFAPFLDYLTFGVLPEHILGSLNPADLVEANFNLDPVGSGPYQFERLITEDGEIKGVALSAFEDYYLDPAYINQIVFRYYPDSQSALAAYQSGDVMGLSPVTSSVLSSALKEPNLNLYTGRLPKLTLIYLNLDHPELTFFQDTAVRRALLMGLNRQWIIDQTLNSQAIIADGPIFPGTWAYYEGIERIPYDPQAAIDLLRQAGYTIPAEGGGVREKDGIPLSFEMFYPDEAPYDEIMNVIQESWSRLGVQVEPTPLPYDELVQDHLDPRAYQAALVDLNFSRSPDPDPYPFWDQAQSTSGQNYAQWSDRQASEYLERARITVDRAERNKAYRNFQVRFSQELPALPLYYPVYSYGVDEQVQGVKMGPLFTPSDRFSSVTSWYLVVSRASEADAETTESPQ